MTPKFQKEYKQSEFEFKADLITHTASKRTEEEVFIEMMKGENPEALLQLILRNSNTNVLDAEKVKKGDTYGFIAYKDQKDETGICAVVDCTNTIDRSPTFQEWNKPIPEYHPMKLFDFCQEHGKYIGYYIIKEAESLSIDDPNSLLGSKHFYDHHQLPEIYQTLEQFLHSVRFGADLMVHGRHMRCGGCGFDDEDHPKAICMRVAKRVDKLVDRKSVTFWKERYVCLDEDHFKRAMDWRGID